MEISLRQANSEETPLIRAMAYRIWHAHYDPIIGSEQVEYMLGKFFTDDALHAQMTEGQVFWFSVVDGAVLGFLSMSPKGPGQYFMHKFYIENGQRGLGLGKLIFEQLLTRYTDLRELRLTVNRHNFKSINFYFKVGFKIECCLDIPIGEGYEMNDFQMLLKQSPDTTVE